MESSQLGAPLYKIRISKLKVDNQKFKNVIESLLLVQYLLD